ncbi:hypothetical protein BS78_02G096600 [Paspalum vaginatum]|nr:hypothetical protein BS78_02G096600 [Paspalum vaginatum]
MVQACPFCGLASEDANSHLQQFLEICSTFTIKGATADAVRLHLFPFSLIGKAKQWFYLNRANLATWEACSNAFLAKYFPLGKTSSLRNRISSFHQLNDETVAEAWERFQEYIASCPHHGMEECLIIQNFFHGLHRTAQEHLDAATGGSFLSLSVAAARTLIVKMASNQGWRQERANNKPHGVYHIDSTDMLATKMDLLLKKLEDAPKAVPVPALDSRMTCEHSGNTGHTGNSCPGNGSEDVNFINNNSFNNGPRPQPGWNSQPHLPLSGQGISSSSSQQFNKNPFDQKAVNDSISKKFLANDRILENLLLQMETLSIAMKNQLSFNKMNARKEQEKPAEPEKEDQVAEPQLVKEAPKSAPHEFYDTIVLPFPQRQKKAYVNDQFGKFVEVIKKLYVNIPLLDAMQVPTYAKYLKDILNNKNPLPSTEVMHLIEECSAGILNQPPQKKKDPGNPTISCSIGIQHFDQALCDLGASVSVMPKVVFYKLMHATLVPTAMCLQLVDQSIRYPDGITEDIPVKVQNFIVSVDFVVLDMEIDSKTLLMLG